ncbi:hypothetical protein BOTBODRAFT_159723 [Botryobasidium botryosum FD-172 SS1]|uniref:CRAL-TRIO domain-containing protein n=1 Tax=Botryobasidium botryosum (strain FD-172 SS1) TaxID=930990 RepID=A0A067MF67_BOTB1|nr:hypothetical protein BOTBODRAFT_159723 [Botryobasidium botryosum FD-172 SS1]
MPPPAPAADPLAGRVGHLTVEQQHILDKFRTMLQEQGLFDPKRHDDPTLLRFLRARKFDFEKAKLMIEEHEKWRKDFGVDELVRSAQAGREEKQLYPQFYHKMDRDGRPLYIEQPGQVESGAITEEGKKKQLQRLVVEYEKFINERLPACSAEAGHPVETSCTILDLKNVGLSQFMSVKDYVRDAAAIGQNQYPECMGKFYIINAPWGFSTAWSIVKGFLDAVTVAKIDVASSSETEQKLLAQIPAENLPSIFPGGKCQCGGGCSSSDAGPWNRPAGGETSTAVAPAP